MSFCVHKPDMEISPKENPPTPAWSPHDDEPSQWMAQAGPRATEVQFVEARGWPSLALRSWYRGRRSAEAGKTEEQLQGIQITFWPRQGVNGGFARRVLPTRPIWPGFAINTVFYAVILWVVFAAPFALRRRKRMRRGLCPACAYPVGDSEVCTECGAAVRKAESIKHKA
jgi:hypothetical protein